MNAKQLHKLNQLNSLRVKRHEKKLSESKEKLLEACEKVIKRDKEIKTINNESGNLNIYLAREKVAKSPTKREYVHIRKFWLNYDLEMHEYYYNQEVDEQSAAVVHHNKIRKQWYKQKMKTEKLSKIYKTYTIENNMKNENQEDEDNQESLI
jgi:hypothetical protein